MEPLRVGIVGIGNISGIYLKNLSAFAETTVSAVADLDRSRAEKAAEEYGVLHVLTPEELISHPEVDLVLNLTIPKVHGSIARQAVANGKHVYNEKPLATEREDALALLAEAKEAGVLVGCAPDTFLGAGLQTVRQVIDSGKIGTPIHAVATMMAGGPEPWHPSPDFFYKPGGGPMLDMGPYYVTALVHLLGPITRVAGLAKATFAERTIGSGDRKGEVIVVETPSHLTGVLEFAQGPTATIITSFDTSHSDMDWGHPIKIYGTEGYMLVPDPNTFGGDVKVKTAGSEDWEIVPHAFPYPENTRGLGVRDIALQLNGDSGNRASGELALHILEAMLAVSQSSESGKFVNLSTQVNRPNPMPAL